jgi:hypothetical protein
MRKLFSIAHWVLFAALAASGVAFAAVSTSSAQKDGADSQMHRGMMGGGMMDMMGSCQSMMASGAGMGAISLPKLPPGNDKLEAQMQAEMLQKMGEIAARYADRVKDSR